MHIKQDALALNFAAGVMPLSQPVPAARRRHLGSCCKIIPRRRQGRHSPHRSTKISSMVSAMSRSAASTQVKASQDSVESARSRPFLDAHFSVGFSVRRRHARIVRPVLMYAVARPLCQRATTAKSLLLKDSAATSFWTLSAEHRKAQLHHRLVEGASSEDESYYNNE